MKFQLGFIPQEVGFWWVLIGGQRGKPKRLSICEVIHIADGDYLRYRAGMSESWRPPKNWLFGDKIELPEIDLPHEPEKWQGVNA